MSERVVAAVDLGAESGRVLAFGFDGERLRLRESQRFANGAREADGFLRWDFEALWSSVRDGLAEVGAAVGRLDSIGVDSWGVDYGLLDADGALLDDPVCYRDGRTRGLVDEAGRLVGIERLYDETGTQLLEINTIYQLFAEARAGGERLARARRLLLIPDLFHYRLSGTAVSETTIASTTGGYDVRRKAWAGDLLSALGIPTGMLPDVADPGTVLGPVDRDVLGGAPFAGTRVVLPGSHDTASAVAGVPFSHPDAAYISSGTWSLVGLETPEPVVTEASRRANLTNEAGAAGRNRLLRNVMGLWLLQECRREWERERGELDYAELVRLAEASTCDSVIAPDDPELLAPGNMPARIVEHCRRAGQPEPETIGDIARCVLVSLAARYAETIDDLVAVAGRPVPAIQIVGGGVHNRLLNRLTADATGLPVYAGPAEATALGNALVQLVALGELDGLDQAREVIRRGESVEHVEPAG